MFETAILASDFECAQCCQFCWSNLKLVRFLVRLFCFSANPFCVFLHSFEVHSAALVNAGLKSVFRLFWLFYVGVCEVGSFVFFYVFVWSETARSVFFAPMFMTFNYCFYSVLRYFVMQRVVIPSLAFIVFENIQSLLSRS